MNFTPQNLDWQLFWLLEVVMLGVPTLAAVIAFRGGPNLSPSRTAVLIFVLVGLTVVNLIVVKLKSAHNGRPLKR